MINGIDLQLLRSGENVLLHFLHDALSVVAEDYFDKIVVPYVNSDHYRGTASLTNKRGVQKSALKEFDIQFLLQLFEFAVDRRKSSMDGLLLPDLTSFLPLTQNNVYHKIRAVIAVRNDWVHAEISAFDETKRAIDITKLLDLFREEVLHVVMVRNDIFTEETRNVVRAYADELSVALLQGPASQQSEAQQSTVQWVAAVSENDPSTGAPAGWNGLPVKLLSVIGIILVSGFLIYRLADNQREKKAAYQLHIVACEPLSPIHLDAARKRLAELIRKDTLGRIVVYSSNNNSGASFEVGRSERDLEEVLGILLGVAKIETAFDLRSLFSNAIPAMNSSGDSAASMIVLGSIGEFSRREERALRAVEDTLYPKGTGTTLRRARTRLRFLRMGARTASDEAVINGFKKASVECEEQTL